MDFKSEIDRFIQKDHNNEDEYLFDALKDKFNHVVFGGNLFIYHIEDIWMNFAFFELNGSQIEDGVEINSTGRLFWYGDGPTGNLRELRHSYFPEYVFYASPVFIKDCCDIILEYFDNN